jgi:hypothetical protein
MDDSKNSPQSQNMIFVLRGEPEELDGSKYTTHCELRRNVI